MIIWGALMLSGGLFLLKYGMVEAALIGGPMVLISGILVIRGHSAAVGLYFLGVVGMCVWVAVTKSVPFAIGSFIFPGLIGLLVAKRRMPVLAGFLILLSSVAMLAPFVIAGTLRPAQVAWRDFRPAQGLFSVKMPSEPIARDPIVGKIAAYTMTRHPYESLIPGQRSTMYVVVDFSPALSIEGVSYDKMLEAELTALVTRTSSTLVSKRSVKVNGYSGLEFELRPPENLTLSSSKNFGKIFMNSEHLYLLGITASESSELLAGKDDFLNPTFTYRSASTQPGR